MYRTRQETSSVVEVLARLRGDTLPAPKPHTTYSTSDIAKAKVVLDRLLLRATRANIVSIRVIPAENKEY